MNRRDLLKSLALAGATASVGAGALSRPERSSSARRALRIAHISDMHTIPERRSGYWLNACLSHLQSLSDRPDIIFNGGDAIHNALGEDEARVQEMWNIWDSIMEKERELPIVHCIGNHDVWGHSTARGDARYGKQWAMDQLELERPYYSFDQSGWHFIVLDSTNTHEDGSWYIGRLDDVQFEWLKEDLEKTPEETPVLIFSHIPIVSAASFFFGEKDRTGDWVIPRWLMHIDARRIVELFYQHENIELAISGHVHLLDEVIYNNVTYFCNGAVSGSWWYGEHRQTPPGYALINLFEDGSFSREYLTYGWQQG